MDHNTTTNADSEVLWLTDSEGNGYLVGREIIEHHRVPQEVASQVKDFVEADTHGYGNSEHLLGGISKLWGLKVGDKRYDPNFDLDGDGQIDVGDWQIAMKGWNEEHPKPPPNL